MARRASLAACLAVCCAPSLSSGHMLSALEVLQFQESLQQTYRLSAEECAQVNGVPLAIGLMRENPAMATATATTTTPAGSDEGEVVAKEKGDEARKIVFGGDEEDSRRPPASRPLSAESQSGWGGAYYTMSFLHPGSSSAKATGKLETGTFSSSSSPSSGGSADLADSIDARVVCLQRDMQFVFAMSRNPNRFEIGALVGSSDFVGPEDTLTISTWDGVYKSRLRRHDAKKRSLNAANFFSHVYYYAPQFRAPTLSPTPYPTWSRAPTPRPSTLRQGGQQQVCLASIPGYDASTWSLSTYCNLYSASACTPETVASFDCAPTYLTEDPSCGATFCHTFSQLASGVCSGAKPSLANSNATLFAQIDESCLANYVNQTYNSSSDSLVMVSWSLSLVLRGVESTLLASNQPSKDAIRQALVRFLPGVPLSAIAVETVAAIDMTPSPTRSPAYIKATQKRMPTPNPNVALELPNSELDAEQRAFIKKNRLRWHSVAPTPHPQPDPATWTSFPTPPPHPTPKPIRSRNPTPRPSPRPTAVPTFPPKLGSLGVSVQLAIVCSAQSMGFSSEQSAYDDALLSLSNAASSKALTLALQDSAVARNGTAVRFAVVLANDVVLTSLGTLPPAATPVDDAAADQADTGLIAGTAAAAVGGVAVGGAVAYKVLGSAKEVVQVMPAEALQGMEGVVLQSF